MIARLLISQTVNYRKEEIENILSQAGLGKDHVDCLYFLSDSKLGIEQARIIKQHFSLKPYSAKGRAVILEDASSLTTEAQNALLKILEELPKEAIFILGASSDAHFLPTIISRCQVIRIKNQELRIQNENYKEDIERLLESGIEEKFEYIEKLKEKKEFLNNLTQYFHSKLPQNSRFAKELLQAEEWINQNVNIRAILEYLMLVMPKKIP